MIKVEALGPQATVAGFSVVLVKSIHAVCRNLLFSFLFTQPLTCCQMIKYIATFSLTVSVPTKKERITKFLTMGTLTTSDNSAYSDQSSSIGHKRLFDCTMLGT